MRTCRNIFLKNRYNFKKVKEKWNIFLERYQKCLLFSKKYSNIYKRFAEMSEWFKEHDWKSCDWENWSGGSNPLLCAKQKKVRIPCLFLFL